MTRSSIILTFLLSLLSSVLYAQPTKPDYSMDLDIELIQSIEAMSREKFPADGAGAVVFVQQNGRTLVKQAFGQANIEFNVPATLDMRFRLGSLTKQFTAVSILILQEQGKLQIDEPLIKYFPEYKVKSAENITLRHLLTHTGGVPNYEGRNGYTHHGTDADRFETIFASFKDEPLEFEPSSQVNYSNAGFVLLGKVIENITGIPYTKFVENNIFKPLGMKDSSFYDHYNIVTKVAKGYEYSLKDKNKILHAVVVKPSLFGDGGIVATVDDLAKWYKALETNLLISDDSKTMAFTAFKLADGRNSKHGLGWKVASLSNYKTVEHGGNTHGTEAYSLMIPKMNLKVIVLTNINRSNPGELVENIATKILSIPAITKPAISMSNEQLERYTGDYRYFDGTPRTIFRKGNALFSKSPSGHQYELVPFADNQFYFKDDFAYWLRFEIDEADMKVFSESRTSAPITGKRES